MANAWIEFCKDYQAKHKSLSWGEVLKQAAGPYREMMGKRPVSKKKGKGGQLGEHLNLEYKDYKKGKPKMKMLPYESSTTADHFKEWKAQIDKQNALYKLHGMALFGGNPAVMAAVQAAPMVLDGLKQAGIFKATGDTLNALTGALQERLSDPSAHTLRKLWIHTIPNIQYDLEKTKNTLQVFRNKWLPFRIRRHELKIMNLEDKIKKYVNQLAATKEYRAYVGKGMSMAKKKESHAVMSVAVKPHPTSLVEGGGFREFLSSVGVFLKKNVPYFKGKTFVIPKSFADFLRKRYNDEIVNIKVCREPVVHVIKKTMNAISLGKFNKNLKKLNYDDIFHLFMVLTFKDGTTMGMERNARLSLRKDVKPKANTQCLADIKTNIKLGTLFENYKRSLGGDFDKIIFYDPGTNNCQDFILGILGASTLLSPTDKNFIKQDTAEAMKKTPVLNSIIKNVVDLGVAWESVFGGNVHGLDKDIFAKMSNEAYQKQRENIDSFRYMKPYSNDDVAVYMDRPKNILVFAYRGTNFKLVKDLVADTHIASGTFRMSKRYKVMKEHFMKISNLFPSFKIVFTGHSLGATIAGDIQHLCKTSGRDCSFVIFNRGSSPIEVYKKGPKDPQKHHHHIKGDWVSSPYLKAKTANHYVYDKKGTNHPHILANFL